MKKIKFFISIMTFLIVGLLANKLDARCPEGLAQYKSLTMLNPTTGLFQTVCPVTDMWNGFCCIPPPEE